MLTSSVSHKFNKNFKIRNVDSLSVKLLYPKDFFGCKLENYLFKIYCCCGGGTLLLGELLLQLAVADQDLKEDCCWRRLLAACLWAVGHCGGLKETRLLLLPWLMWPRWACSSRAPGPTGHHRWFCRWWVRSGSRACSWCWRASGWGRARPRWTRRCPRVSGRGRTLLALSCAGNGRFRFGWHFGSGGVVGDEREAQ